MKIIQTVLILMAFAPCARAGVDPSYAKVTVFNAWLAESGDCSNPINVFSYPNGSTFDMVTSPKIGEGTIPAKIYKCMVMEIANEVHFASSVDSGSCAKGQDIGISICRAGTTVTKTDGTTTTCTGNSSDHLFVYLSRFTSNPQTNQSFMPPVQNGDADHGNQLLNDIDVTQGGGSFIFGTGGTIDGSGSSCRMLKPSFGFRVGNKTT